MRSIYLGKKKECPSCGGPKDIYPVGAYVNGFPIWACKNTWHRTMIECIVPKKLGVINA